MPTFSRLTQSVINNGGADNTEMPRTPEQDRGKAVRLVRMELQARLCESVRTQRKGVNPVHWGPARQSPKPRPPRLCRSHCAPLPGLAGDRDRGQRPGRGRGWCVRRRTARAPTARVNDACELVAQNGMRVDFLDTFLLCSVGTQRKVLP